MGGGGAGEGLRGRRGFLHDPAAAAGGSRPPPVSLCPPPPSDPSTRPATAGVLVGNLSASDLRRVLADRWGTLALSVEKFLALPVRAQPPRCSSILRRRAADPSSSAAEAD